MSHIFISREEALNLIREYSSRAMLKADQGTVKILERLLHDMKKLHPTCINKYYDYTEIEPLWNCFREKLDGTLTYYAKQLKEAMWAGYEKGLHSYPWIPCRWQVEPGSGLMPDFQTPEDNEEIMITVRIPDKTAAGGYLYRIAMDVCIKKDEDKLESDSGYDWVQDIVAWCPLGEEYKVPEPDIHKYSIAE